MKPYNTSYTICIVILHYNDAEMTIEYINKLKSLNWCNIHYHFIVVDNASYDVSGERLKKQYETDDLVDVILLSKNEGFARGNNVGIRYAIEKYDSDLVIVSNNDISITDKDFPSKIVNEYERSGFDVFGPDIYSIYRNIHQSPICNKYLEVEGLKQKIVDIDKKLKKLRIIERLGVYELIRGIKRIVKPENISVENWDKRQENVVIQGAFFAISRGYLEAYPDGLYPGTFLYMEEDILNYRVIKKGLKAIYEPSIKVEHLEGASTRNQAGDRCRKYIFELEHTRESCLEMIKYLEENNT